MKVIRFGRTAAVFAVGALALTACGSDNAANPAATGGATGASTAAAQLTGTLTGSGSSAQEAAMNAWKAGFESSTGAKVQYSPEGSGAGRKALIGGAVQFAGSDAYLKEEELEDVKKTCGPDGALNVPVYISPIAIAFNLEGVKELNLDGDTIAKIFRGDIKKWNDQAIASQNEGVELPDTEITPVHRSDDSGTTDNFTDYLATAASKVWTDEADGEWPKALGGENAKGTSGVVSTTSSTAGAITYADDSAVTDTLGKVKVKVGEEYVGVSPEAAAKAADVAKPVDGRGENDLAFDLQRDTTESGTYPVVLVSYHIFCTSYKDQETVDLVKAFGSYVVSEEGQNAAAESAKSAPMSSELAEKAKTAIESIKVAS